MEIQLEENQNPPGNLIMALEERNQNPQGDLISANEASPFETQDESYEELAVDLIQNCTSIPDYKAVGTLKYPQIVKSPITCVCIDGWSHVEQAREHGDTSIFCHVEHVAEITEDEAAIRKAAIRIQPKVGGASYSEIIRNVRTLFCILSSKGNMVVHNHGGDRKSEMFANNKEDDIVSILADRFGKERRKISEYLNHSRYCDGETLEILVDLGVKKDFFEKAQANKRFLETELRSQNTPEDEITGKISQKILEMQKEYAINGKIKGIAASIAEPSPEVPPSEMITPTQPRVLSFNPWAGNAEKIESLEQEITIEDIQKDFENIGNKFLLYGGKDNATPDELLEYCKDEIKYLIKTVTKISKLKIRMDCSNETEVMNG